MFQPSWNDGLTRFDQLIALHFLSFLFQIKLVPSPDNVCLFLGAMVHFKSNYAKEELVLKKKIIRYLHLRYETSEINIFLTIRVEGERETYTVIMKHILIITMHI